MTVAGNIEYPLRKRRVAKDERVRRVRGSRRRVLELEELLDRKPRELSGGQQQRVALGRALVRDPAAFLLDEPLSNLDAKLRTHMRAELIRLHRRIGCTMVYVTHDQLEAMTMSQRIAVLRDGRLQQFAPPRDIYARPGNDFVAGFIGTPSMNFLDGRLEGTGSGRTFRCGDLSLPVGMLPLTDEMPEPDRRVRLGIRPEHIHFDRQGEPRARKPGRTHWTRDDSWCSTIGETNSSPAWTGMSPSRLAIPLNCRSARRNCACSRPRTAGG